LTLIPLIAVWSLGLLFTLHLDAQDRRSRLQSEAHVLETVSFYVRERQALPLQTALEKLRAASGYTSLNLCHRGQMVMAAGISRHRCQASNSALIEGWDRPIPGAGGYVLSAETRVVTLFSSLCFLILGLSLILGLFHLLNMWFDATSRRDWRSEMKVKING
jgi:hypothetical protein